MCVIFHLLPSCSPHASLCQHRRRDMPPREVTFRVPRGGISAPERRTLGSQEAAFYKLKGIVLISSMLQMPFRESFFGIRPHAEDIVFYVR